MPDRGTAWWPTDLAAIARKLGIAATDLTPPRSSWHRSADGTRVHALDWGGTGPASLLLHGGGLTAHTWDYVAVALRSRFRLVALDLRGHGNSDWADQYTFERSVADVLSVLDGLAIDRAHVAGMSLGGQVGAWFALAHAARTASLAMVDVAPGVVFEATQRMRDFVSNLSGAGALEAVVDQAMAVSPRSDPERVRYRLRAMLKDSGAGELRWRADMRRPVDYGYILGQLERLSTQAQSMQMPFLLLRGARSKILSEADAAAFAARFPRGAWLNIADAGHNVQEDNPAKLAEVLSDFWLD